MTITPAPLVSQLPAFDPDDGSVMQYAGKHARNAVLTVFEMRGGARGLFDWTTKSAQNEADFYKTIFPKTIQKEVQIDDKRSIEDVLAVIDGDFSVVDNPVPAVASPQDFSAFQGIVVGDVDYDEEPVDE